LVELLGETWLLELFNDFESSEFKHGFQLVGSSHNAAVFFVHLESPLGNVFLNKHKPLLFKERFYECLSCALQEFKEIVIS
jgi:hypothetical protein